MNAGFFMQSVPVGRHGLERYAQLECNLFTGVAFTNEP